MAKTEYFDLTVYGSEVGSVKFKDWVMQNTGNEDSNMTKIDTALHNLKNTLSDKAEFYFAETVADLSSIENPDGKFCIVLVPLSLYYYNDGWKQFTGINGKDGEAGIVISDEQPTGDILPVWINPSDSETTYFPIPHGGQAGQVLMKLSDKDGDFGWVTIGGEN